MKIDREQEKELFKTIRLISKKNNYKSRGGRFFSIKENAFVYFLITIKHHEIIDYYIEIKEYEYDDIFLENHANA